MLMAVQLLDKANQEELLPSGSVSLIILLTDGDPTIGECTAQREQLGFYPGLLWDLGWWGRGVPEVPLALRFQKYPLSKSLFSQPLPKPLCPGETNPKNIQKNVQDAINGQYSLFCLGFGFDVSYAFLEKLALDNGGLARRIYEDSDSALQLQVPTCPHRLPE